MSQQAAEVFPGTLDKNRLINSMIRESMSMQWYDASGAGESHGSVNGFSPHDRSRTDPGSPVSFLISR